MPWLGNFCKKYRILFSLLITQYSLSGCSHILMSSNIERANLIAIDGSMTIRQVSTSQFIYTTFLKISKPGAPLIVFIEGDGFSWITKKQPSDNPTPLNPVGLKLAVDASKHLQESNVLYLARPCQFTSFVTDRACKSDFWTHARYSEVVVHSSNEVIDQIVSDHKLNGIHIIGYSGGAALGALISSRRIDMLSFNSVAGNLDPEALNQFHGVSALQDSLNPIDVAKDIAYLPQMHWVGGQDKIIPTQIAQNWFKNSNQDKGVQIIFIKDATHTEGWPNLSHFFY